MVTAPTVTAILNGYLFLKNAVFRLMATSFKKNSKASQLIEKLRQESNSLQKLYIPKLIETIRQVDEESAVNFENKMKQFHPRLVMNMIDEPKDADKALKIRRSCQQYLGLDVESLGIMYRDSLQDKALSSRLPVVVYKPNSIISQGIYRIAEKVLQSETLQFNGTFEDTDTSYEISAEEAGDDYSQKLSFVEDLLGTGTFTVGELAETIKTQQYEINQLKSENLLLKSKLVKAAKQGFTI